MREGGKKKKLEIGHDEIIYTTNTDKLQIRVLPFQELIVPIDHWNQRSDSNSEEPQGDCEHSRNMICYLFYLSVKDQSSTMWRVARHSGSRTSLEGHGVIQAGNGGAQIITEIDQQNVDGLG